MQYILINAANQKCYEDSLSIPKEMYERNFHWKNLTVQLGQFAAFLDTRNISATKLFDSLVNLGINKTQKMLLPEVTKLAKLRFVLPATNATFEWSFSTMKRVKTYLRSTTSGD